MAGITPEQANTQLNLYLDAEQKVLAGQRVRIGDKDLTRADLEFIQKGITIWNARVNELEREAIGRPRVRQAVPL